MQGSEKKRKVQDMRINHNMSAVTANAQLLKNETGLAASMERLSSGLKINRAKDDPAGMAISNKMQAQIDGLAKSSENASNGISVLQIADTALGEITSMLQRMRELSVQAANDTNQLPEREAIQQEIDSLRDEVDRISRDTEYNTKKLLDGSSDVRVYAEGLSRMAVSDSVVTGEYVMQIDAAATQSTISATTAMGDIPAGTVIINGSEIKISEGEDAEAVFEKLRRGAELADVSLMVVDPALAQDYTTYPTTGGYVEQAKTFAYGDAIAFVSNEYGAASGIDITCDNANLEAFLGLAAATESKGKDADVKLDLTSSFGPQATIAMEGNKATITDVAGFEMSFKVEPGRTGEVDIDVTDVGTMTLQIGANEHQTMEVRIPEVSSATLYLDEVDVTKIGGGGRAITTLDEAIQMTSMVRSAVGAFQNRLEYAVDSLDASNEDTTAALSRISDVDMAKEMTEYTKYTVLQQAGTSVLAQANDIPQTVLQLLQ